MEAIFYLALASIFLLGPLFFFIFYGTDIFGFSKYLSVVYVACMAIGWLWWEPLAFYTPLIAWAIVIISWIFLLWQIFFHRNE